ncbi:dihydrofolate reductase family protein [Nocardioides ferulae]|uniref:dihydrofolate reductase family protein n=1 Tax=Nocardioides ferulae TaxID=2340821 RepID=UPI000EB5585C|nr:dihydrofolate reductase family protein [Nocardioides ferulae]
MRRLVAIEFVTLDGVMQGLGSPDEDRDGGFEHGGWGAPYMDETQMQSAGEGLAQTTAYLFGRRTYQKMLAFWPHQPDSNPMAAHLNATPKYVVTRTLDQFSWAGARRLGDDLGSGVRALKDEGEGVIAILGSGIVVHELMQQRLIDEYRIFLHPLLLGTGKRLFRDLPQPQRLQLAGATPTSTGVVMLEYRVDG